MTTGTELAGILTVERQRSSVMGVELESERDRVRPAEYQVDNEKARGD